MNKQNTLNTTLHNKSFTKYAEFIIILIILTMCAIGSFSYYKIFSDSSNIKNADQNKIQINLNTKTIDQIRKTNSYNTNKIDQSKRINPFN